MIRDVRSSTNVQLELHSNLSSKSSSYISGDDKKNTKSLKKIVLSLENTQNVSVIWNGKLRIQSNFQILTSEKGENSGWFLNNLKENFHRSITRRHGWKTGTFKEWKWLLKTAETYWNLNIGEKCYNFSIKKTNLFI